MRQLQPLESEAESPGRSTWRGRFGRGPRAHRRPWVGIFTTRRIIPPGIAVGTNCPRCCQALLAGQPAAPQAGRGPVAIPGGLAGPRAGRAGGGAADPTQTPTVCFYRKGLPPQRRQVHLPTGLVSATRRPWRYRRGRPGFARCGCGWATPGPTGCTRTCAGPTPPPAALRRRGRGGPPAQRRLRPRPGGERGLPGAVRRFGLQRGPGMHGPRHAAGRQSSPGVGRIPGPRLPALLRSTSRRGGLFSARDGFIAGHRHFRHWDLASLAGACFAAGWPRPSRAWGPAATQP